MSQASLPSFQDIFLVFDKNNTHQLEYKEVGPALEAAGRTRTRIFTTFVELLVVFSAVEAYQSTYQPTVHCFLKVPAHAKSPF